MKLQKSTIIKISILILLFLLMLFLQLKWDVASYLSSERIESWLEQAGPLAPILYMIIMALAVIISPIPSMPLDIAAGAYFGPIMGTLYSALGALGGAVISFLIARFLGREIIEQVIGGHINFCTYCSDKLLTKIVFISRLIPFISFDIISYGAGLTKMSLNKFAIATFLGMLPITFVYNYFGSVIVSSGWLGVIFGIIFVVVLLLFPRWVEKYNLFSLRKYFQHKETPEPNWRKNQ